MGKTESSQDSFDSEQSFEFSVAFDAKVGGEQSPMTVASDGELRFVTDATILEPLGHLLSARGNRFKDRPVKLTVTSDALLFDLSSPTIPCTFRVPLVKSCSAARSVSIEIPSKLLRCCANLEGKSFEGRTIWIVCVAEAAVRVLHGTTNLHVSTPHSPPVRAHFPGLQSTPEDFEPKRLREALLAVEPGASANDRLRPQYGQIGVEDCRATAMHSRLYAEHSHPALDGLTFRIKKQDVDAVATLLDLVDIGTAKIRADASGVLISDQSLRFAFFPLDFPLPETKQFSKLKAEYTFDCDYLVLLRALVIAGMVVAGSAARSLQIGLSLVFDSNGTVYLRAVTEWGHNRCEHSKLPINMSNDQQKSAYAMSKAPCSEQSLHGNSLLPHAASAQQKTLDLGFYSHSQLFGIVKRIKAHVVSCNFISHRACWLKSSYDDVAACFLFEGLQRDQAHGLRQRR